MPILTYFTFLPLCNGSSYRLSIDSMPSKSSTSDEPRRRSARLSSTVVIDGDGKARSEENSNKNNDAADTTSKVIVHEEGQNLNQDEIDAVNAHIVSGGCTELVDPTKWKDHASLEHAEFHDKMIQLKETLESKLTDEEKAMYQDAIDSYEHAMRIEYKKEMDKKDAAGNSISDDKHESVVATAGANAHMAAITAGKSAFSADASMASAMGKQEENYLAKLMAKREELEMEIKAAKKVATGYHATELIATAKDASQEAANKADKIGTRHNKSEAEKRKNEADALESAIGSASGSTSTGEIVIPPHLALTMPKQVQSIATTLGFDVQNADESEDAPNQANTAKASKKKPLSAKARGKLPIAAVEDKDEEMKNADDADDADDDDDDEDEQQNNEPLGIMSGSSKKRGKKRGRGSSDGDEPPKERKKRAVDPNKIPASTHYANLGIKNSSQLGDVVERLNDYKEKVEELTEHNKRLAKLEKQVEKFTERENTLRSKHTQTCEMYNKAVQYLVNECKVPKSVLFEKGIAHRSKK